MQQEGFVYWRDLWSELSLRLRHGREGGRGRRDPWEERAARFDAFSRQRAEGEADPLMEAVRGLVRPTDSVVDIGAGTGRWTVFLAPLVARVTALEPSPAMAAILERNLGASGAGNAEVVRERWESAEVGPHDVALCSHSMYSSPDLPAFVRKMDRVARRTCVLVMRVPSHEGVIGDLSYQINGEWHDSPNFVIGYNILRGIGIFPSVLLEPGVRHWSDASLEDAVARARRHLRLPPGSEHEGVVRQALEQALVRQDGGWLWPDGMRSALAWWSKPEG